MSTICKLDPLVRIARTLRRSLLAHFLSELRNARKLPVSKRAQIEAYLLPTIELLAGVLNSSRLTGVRKDQLARRITRELAKLLKPPKLDYHA